MRFHNVLEDILSSKLKISILRILLRYPDKKFSGRELARLLNISASRASEILELFRKYGLISRIKIGPALEWTLNKESILIKELISLFNLEKKIYLELKSKILKMFDREEKILRVMLYGSIPQSKENPDSDIDLFILVKGEKDKERAGDLVHKLNMNLLPKYGNVISGLIYSRDEWRRKKKNEIVKKIQSEGEIILNRKSM